MNRHYLFLTIAGLIMAAAGCYLALTNAPLSLILCGFGGAIAMLAVPLLEHWLDVRLPAWLQVSYGLFVVASLLVGQIGGLYGYWWPWDGVLHFSSGILIAGFGIVLLNQRLGNLNIVLPIIGRIILIGMFSATIALLWEVVEFALDTIFGTFSQRNDLPDTMLDMIYGTTSGTLTAVAYYSQEKVAKSPK